MRHRFSLVLATALGLGNSVAVAAEPLAAPGYTLERVVLVLRHGVRPPTKSAKSMAALSDLPWPDESDWGVAPGELTRRGSAAIRHLGTDLRHFYVDGGLLPNLTSDQSLIWADGADQRTRATAQFLALGLAADAASPPSVSWSKSVLDPLFDGLDSGVCQLDPAAAQLAVQAQGKLDTPEISAALQQLQNVMAPEACAKGAGICLAGPSKLQASTTEVKITGPLSTGGSVTESLLLEYENNLPMAQVAWGRASRADLDSLIRIHEHTSNLTRRTPYIAVRRAYALTDFILKALSEDAVSSTTPAIGAAQRLVVLTGHDTNLSNLAGVFGLDWTLPGQSDSTAPGTTIAFERWRENGSGKTVLKMRLFYQSLDQVRNLTDTPAQQIDLQPSVCKAESTACEMDRFVAKIRATLPTDCRLHRTPD